MTKETSFALYTIFLPRPPPPRLSFLLWRSVVSEKTYGNRQYWKRKGGITAYDALLRKHSFSKDHLCHL